MWALLKKWDFWFGLLGALGLVFAVFTYVITNKVGRISYSFDTQKVFDPANLSGFTLVNADKIPIERPVYATEIVVWNSGDLSLSDSSDRVREPLRIKVNGVIYYQLISKVNLVDAENYRIDFSQDRSIVTMNWKFFDPGQGIRLTLMHSDNGEPKITLSGRFYEASLREEVQLSIKKRAEVQLLWLFGLIIILLSTGLFILTRKWVTRPARDHKEDRSRTDTRLVTTLNRFISLTTPFLALIMATQGITLIGIYIYFNYLSTAPPV